MPNNQLLKLPLSSLSSYKLLLKKFESLEFSGSIDDNINFYRLINKYSSNILPEESVDIYRVLRRNMNESLE